MDLTDDVFEQVNEWEWRCTECGKVISSSIFNMYGHWSECSGKSFVDTLAKEKEGRE